MASWDLLHLFGAFLAALVAGAINSVAGGGSMISFPILVALGLPPLFANATNTLGIWPGALGSIWGFRDELARVPRRRKILFVLPALLGGLIGAFLLRLTPESVFNKIIPWLILFATALFLIQAPVQKRLKLIERSQHESGGWLAAALLLQLTVAIYGGYFGAGMSIMMLSILGLIGMTDMLEMSAMTSFLSLAINGISGLVFAISGLIFWPYVVVMAVGAIVGGYGAAGIARKLGKVWIRRFVIFVGFSLAVVMFVKVLHDS